MAKIHHNLQLEIQAPTALNFLIYVQNCFLNNYEKYEHPKFPYIFSEVALLLEHEKFSDVFNEIWDRILTDFNQHPNVNNNIDTHLLLIQKLFTKQKSFNETYASFLAWWKGLAGYFTIQNSLDDDKINKLYSNLLNEFQKTNIYIEKHIKIFLVYDNCELLYSYKNYDNQIVLSIEDIVLRKNLVNLEDKFKHFF